MKNKFVEIIKKFWNIFFDLFFRKRKVLESNFLKEESEKDSFRFNKFFKNDVKYFIIYFFDFFF